LFSALIFPADFAMSIETSIIFVFDKINLQSSSNSLFSLLYFSGSSAIVKTEVALSPSSMYGFAIFPSSEPLKYSTRAYVSIIYL
jgi:hypothetical protein